MKNIFAAFAGLALVACSAPTAEVVEGEYIIEAPAEAPAEVIELPAEVIAEEAVAEEVAPE